MSLVQMELRVYLTDGATHDVDVIFGDLMRGELEANKLGVDESLGLHMAAIYAWCALQRTHVLDPIPFPVFKETLLDGLDIVSDSPVDPTSAGPSGSPAS